MYVRLKKYRYHKMYVRCKINKMYVRQKKKIDTTKCMLAQNNKICVLFKIINNDACLLF